MEQLRPERGKNLPEVHSELVEEPGLELRFDSQASLSLSVYCLLVIAVISASAFDILHPLSTLPTRYLVLYQVVCGHDLKPNQPLG